MTIQTREQKIIWDMQRLEVSKWRKYIIEALLEDKERLINNLVYDFKWTDVNKEYSEADLWRNKIGVIDDIITMPWKIKNEYAPIIKTNSLDM